jgi:hypothetical protein
MAARNTAGGQRLLGELERFRFFEKETWLRGSARALALLAAGCALTFLSHAPFAEWRPLLVDWGDGYFRYSFFGNLLLAAGFYNLAQLETPGSVTRALTLLGVPLSLAHGAASFLDPLSLFGTDALLELAMVLLPLACLLRYLRRLPIPVRPVLVLAVILALWLSWSLLATRALGTAGIVTNIPLFRLSAFQGAWEAASQARLLTTILGLFLTGGFLLVRHCRHLLLPGFPEMAKRLYHE